MTGNAFPAALIEPTTTLANTTDSEHTSTVATLVPVAERNATIARRAEHGDTFTEIGTDYGISRERVRQIVKSHTGKSGGDLVDTRTERRTGERITQVRDYAQTNPEATIADIMAQTNTTRSLVSRALTRTEMMRRESPAAYTSMPDAAVHAEMRRVAALDGGTPLTGAFYDEHRETSSKEASLSATRLVQRYGTWVQACRAAGVQARQPNGSRVYTRRWSTEQMTRAVWDYLNTHDRPTYAEFENSLRGRDDVPSAQTIRNTLGPWADMKRVAITEHGTLADLAA